MLATSASRLAPMRAIVCAPERTFEAVQVRSPPGEHMCFPCVSPRVCTRVAERLLRMDEIVGDQKGERGERGEREERGEPEEQGEREACGEREERTERMGERVDEDRAERVDECVDEHAGERTGENEWCKEVPGERRVGLVDLTEVRLSRPGLGEDVVERFKVVVLIIFVFVL
nr:MAG: hypothetical protein AmFV_00260 [Apis mellifera filamentous virus]